MKMLRWLLLASAMPLTGPLYATYAIFEHGAGIQSQAMGGISYTVIDDPYVAAANPALLFGMRHRLDFGMNYLQVSAQGAITGNALGPDEHFNSTGARHFFVPQLGYVRPLNDRVAVGVSAFSAGVGTDFPRSPYERFGGAPRSAIALGQSGVALAVAVEVLPGHVFGASVNPSYQTFRLKGLEAFSAASVDPQRFSNQGTDGSFGVSTTLGWSARLFPWLEAGLSFRTRTVGEKLRRYRGLLPDRGRLQTPAVWGGGLAAAVHPQWTLAVEAQRVEYGSEGAYSNSIRQLDEGHAYGERNGPGFGWRSQNIYKLGVAWQATSELRLLAGYSRATQLIPEGEAFFGILAPGIAREHFTLGARWSRQLWDFAGHLAYIPRRRLHGEDSVPDAFGGGEADVRFVVYPMGLSLTRRFGG